jgi:hypothetical protein
MPKEIDCKADRHADGDATESIQGGEENGGHRAAAGSEAIARAEQSWGERRYRQISIIQTFDADRVRRPAPCAHGTGWLPRAGQARALNEPGLPQSWQVSVRTVLISAIEEA